MMNYLWGGLIIISVVFAIGGDAYDLYENTYENERKYDLTISQSDMPLVDNQLLALTLAHCNIGLKGQYKTNGNQSQLLVDYSATLPEQWQRRFSDDKEKKLALKVFNIDSATLQVKLPAVIWPRLERMMQAAFDMAEFAAKLAIGLVGLMALWLGLMQIAEKSGLVGKLVRLVRPVLRPLFPEVPADHPAMGAISLNLAANMLGLGNAATPMGIKAMQHLQELNGHKDTASNSMCMFLAMNTSSVQLLPPVTVIALLGVGASGLFVSIFLATLCSTIVAIVAARWFASRDVKT
ncbi:MAG: nucleoside recognition domain-containing protein [Gammaproteobacteria bacterium]